MMTIKDFAKMCGCNTQTLRYYDRIDLLKPAKVDEMTGYRYYEVRQALDYVRIKNLQLAEFSIDEIKNLLFLSDEEVYQAFQGKIAFHKERLSRMMEIQASYLAETRLMERLIESLAKLLFSDENQEEQLQEFGLDASDMPRIIEMFREYIQKNVAEKEEELYLRTDDDVVGGYEEVIETIEKLDKDNLPNQILIGDLDTVNQKPFQIEDYREIWSKGGWNHVHEIIDDIPVPDKGITYAYVFHIRKIGNVLPYGTLFLYALMIRRDLKDFNINCFIHESTDGENRLAVLEKTVPEKTETG